MDPAAAAFQVIPFLGMIIPNMGTIEPPAVTPADALFASVRQRVLAPLFSQPERSYYVNELVRIAGSGIGAVQRELESLAAGELVIVTRQGNQKHYQANPDSPIFAELRSIVVKTSGYTERLRTALTPLADEIGWALLYGSAAQGKLHGKSDLDVMVISDSLTLEDLYKSLSPAETDLGRKVNPTLYTRKEFKRRIAARNAFLTKVLAGKYVTLCGSQDALG